MSRGYLGGRVMQRVGQGIRVGRRLYVVLLRCILRFKVVHCAGGAVLEASRGGDVPSAFVVAAWVTGSDCV
eukprot:8955046-Alexandrium_andersonii.AAC.1